MSTATDLMNALRSQESTNSDNPDITNPDSGARGPWQIMPANWPSWAKAAGLPVNAPWTLANQEKVVQNQIQTHLEAGYSPQDVAAIWYSGQPLGDNADSSQGNYPTIRAYVNSIMGKMGQDPNWQPGQAQVTDKPSPVATLPALGNGKFPFGGASNTGNGPSMPKPFSSPVKSYNPVGTYADDLQGYANQMAAAETALNKFKSQHPEAVYEADPQTGTVSKWVKDDTTGKWVQEPDPQATAIYAPYMVAKSAAGRLVDLQQAGLTNSPADAAKAYVASETEHVKSAANQHADYVKRISDLAAIENIPIDRMQNLATALKSVNSYNQARQSPYETKLYGPETTSFTDVGPYATQAKANIGTDSAPYNMNPQAWNDTSGQTQKVPIPDPQSVISSAGFNTQGALGRIGAGVTAAGAANTYAPGKSFANPMQPPSNPYSLPTGGFPAPYNPDQTHSAPDKLSWFDDLVTSLLGGR